MPDQWLRLVRVVQEVSVFLLYPHPTPLLPWVTNYFFTTFPTELVERLLPFYHDPLVTARAPRRPALVVWIRCTWACISAALLLRQLRKLRRELQRYAARDRRERIRDGQYSPTISSGPPSLCSQADLD